MTTYFVVPRELFFELKDRRHLRRLADVLLGGKRASVIGLDDGHVFSRATATPAI